MNKKDSENYYILFSEKAGRSFTFWEVFLMREFVPLTIFIIVFWSSYKFLLFSLLVYICFTIYRIKVNKLIRKDSNISICNNGLIIDNQYYHFTEIEEILVNRYFQHKGFAIFKIDHLGFSLLLKNGTVIRKIIDGFDKSNLITVYLNQINLNLQEEIYEFELFKPLNTKIEIEKFNETTFRNKPFENELYSKPDLNLDFYYKGTQLCIRKNNTFYIMNFEDIDYLEFGKYEDSPNDGYVEVHFIDMSTNFFTISYSVETSKQLCRDLNFRTRDIY